MAITPESRIHGACIAELVSSICGEFPDLRLAIHDGLDRSSHTLTVLNPACQQTLTVGIYMKYSRNRRSPWDYSYDRKHQEEVDRLFRSHGEVFTILIAGDDGYACINHSELKVVLDDKFDDVEWIRVSRKLNESYRISGKDGSYARPLKRRAFPDRITAHIGDKFGLKLDSR
jgi:hypothetical protein